MTPYRVLLAVRGNPDFQQDPNKRPLGAPPDKIVSCATWEEVVAKVDAFHAYLAGDGVATEADGEMGLWAGGDVWKEDGTHLGRVVWDNGQGYTLDAASHGPLVVDGQYVLEEHAVRETAPARPSVSKELPKFPPRVRFNWGFHDGAGDAQDGREPVWKAKGHHDPVYVAGYHSGVETYRRLGVRPASSDDAWAIYALRVESAPSPAMQKVEHTGSPKSLLFMRAKVPTACVKKSHILALRMVGFDYEPTKGWIDTPTEAGIAKRLASHAEDDAMLALLKRAKAPSAELESFLMRHHFVEVGTSEPGAVEGLGFDAAWDAMLEEYGLEPYASEPFVQQLRARSESDGHLGWRGVVQTILSDMPPEAVPAMDFDGAYWPGNTNQSTYVVTNFGMRVTRDDISVDAPARAREFCQNLDRATETNRAYADATRLPTTPETQDGLDEPEAPHP